MSLPTPPVAQQRPYSYERHGVTISDPWAWLRDPGYPEVTNEDVLSYLREENAYFEAWKAPHEGLVEELFQEMKGRIKEDDASVPIRDGDWLYWTEFKTGTQYRLWYRKPVGGGDTQLLLDENAEAEGHDYFRLGAIANSNSGRIMAYSTDTNGSERYTIRFRDIGSGTDVGDPIEGARAPWGEDGIEGSIGQIVFSADDAYLFYGIVDEFWRCRTIRRHKLGTPSSEDRTVYFEEDETFSASVGLSTDKQWLVITTGNNSTNETHLIPAADPTSALHLVKSRKNDVQYEVDSAHGRLWILTNDEHVNFRIASADPANAADWQTEVAGSDRTYLRGISSHRDHLLITARVDGLDQLLLRDYATGDTTRVPFTEASYSAGFAGNPDYAPDAYRIVYSSMVTPATTYDYHPADQRLEVLKVQEIPSGYDASLYTTDRLMIEARDGVKVPVSVLRRKDFPLDGSGKLFIYAYGAYGFAIPPSFSTSRLSLVERGFAYAIAHIRGGDDLGYQWFLDGKLKKRTNTFNDFVDVTRGLIDAGYAKAGRVGAQGGSAGGELMGAVVNQASDLYGAVVADVPFVDVLNTMLDDTLPLTPGEWTEWGNPITDKAAFDLIRSYSPYDQVSAKAYPPMLITGGLTDPRVTYWEPAKWAARLRATKTDDNRLLLKINMGAGHGGKSGRWDSLKEVAEAYAFVTTEIV